MLADKLFIRDDGYVMTFTEMDRDMIDTIASYFESLDVCFWDITKEIDLIISSLMDKLTYHDKVSYRERTWKRLE